MLAIISEHESLAVIYFLTQHASNYPREERVSYLDTLAGGTPRACRQYLLLSVYGVHHGPCLHRLPPGAAEKPSSRSLERGCTPK